MPQRQGHRGKHPEDGVLFAARWHAVLRDAVADLSHLLTRGYAEKAALKLVGDHYQLHLRQRMAVLRAACSDESMAQRRARLVPASDMRGQRVIIDGYNLLITAESALSGGILIGCRDGCVRDIASIHGTYRRVQETAPALALLGESIQALGIAQALWYLDAPISNSGSLAGLMRQIAQQRAWQWEVELHSNPDRLLEKTQDVVVTSDGIILDRGGRWFNLIEFVLGRMEPVPEVVELGLDADPGFSCEPNCQSLSATCARAPEPF